MTLTALNPNPSRLFPNRYRSRRRNIQWLNEHSEHASSPKHKRLFFLGWPLLVSWISHCSLAHTRRILNTRFLSQIMYSPRLPFKRLVASRQKRLAFRSHSSRLRDITWHHMTCVLGTWHIWHIWHIFDIWKFKKWNAGLVTSIAWVEEDRVISFILPMTTVETSVQALNGLLQRLGPTAHRCGAGEALGVDSAQIYSGLCSLMHNEVEHTVTSSIFIETYGDSLWLPASLLIGLRFLISA